MPHLDRAPERNGRVESAAGGDEVDGLRAHGEGGGDELRLSRGVLLVAAVWGGGC